MTSPKETPIALFKRHPYTAPSTLVMHNQRYFLGELSEAYFESAQVVASKFDGQAPSDIFLLPYLFLMRHAFELLLKDGVIVLKKLRVLHFGADPESMFKNKTPIDYITQYRHNLMSLLNELRREFNSFGFQEQFPTGIEAVLNLLHQADESSTKFRYGTQLQEKPAYINAKSLCGELVKQFKRLSITIDYACGSCQYLPIVRDDVL